MHWFKTGDEAIISETRQIFIVGRHKEVIIKGGENISPVAIEMAISNNPQLACEQIQIDGAPDFIAGQVPVAVVKEEPSSDNFDCIRKTVLEQMGPKYVPSELIKLHDLGLEDWPRTLMGKLLRLRLSSRVGAYIKKRNDMISSMEAWV
jgi:acyl-CoA synthetase (AMP-forming)/AMP-acid ligase II